MFASSKKKVVIKSKDLKGVVEPTPTVTKKRGRPAKSKNTTDVTVKPSLPSSRVYNLGASNSKVKSTSYIVNNIVQLNINIKDIRMLEKKILQNESSLIKDIESSQEPAPWNDQQKQSKVENNETSKSTHSPFKSIIRRGNINIVTTTPEQSESKINRKDLIINSGVKRTAKPIMNIYNQCWPSNSTYACWYCCHKFSTTPVGIPQIFINNEFHCYGNFCSYNCAKRYLRPQTEDDLAMLQTSSDVCVGDDLGEKMQLLELLYHIETNSDIDQPIKIAPSRLSLQMFGGDKTIEEYRSNFDTHNSYHVFRSPLVPISYQMEECSDKMSKKVRQRVSIDTVKIERAYNELAKKANNNKGHLKKMLIKN